MMLQKRNSQWMDLISFCGSVTLWKQDSLREELITHCSNGNGHHPSHLETDHDCPCGKHATK